MSQRLILAKIKEEPVRKDFDNFNSSFDVKPDLFANFQDSIGVCLDESYLLQQNFNQDEYEQVSDTPREPILDDMVYEATENSPDNEHFNTMVKVEDVEMNEGDEPVIVNQDYEEWQDMKFDEEGNCVEIRPYIFIKR